MKSLFPFLIGLCSFSTSFAAHTPLVNPSTTLYHYFPVGQEVVWTSVNKYQKATFSIEGTVYNAFFDNGGDLVATTHAISLKNLPKGLQASLQKEMKNYWISDLIVMSTKEGKNYYVQLEYAGTKVIKQAFGNKWVAYKNL